IALTDSAGTVHTAYSYAPFGETTRTGTVTTNPFQFTGRENDGLTGLYHYRARYYHPILQRFISEDPLGLAGGYVNVYGYVANDPVNLRDPSGLYLGWWPRPGSIPFPDITFGIDSPVGGVETTFPFGSGGSPTTIQRGPSFNLPLGLGSNACFLPYVDRTNVTGGISFEVSTPLGGTDIGVDINGNLSGAVTGPQLNFPFGFGVNGYIGTVWPVQ
ncbi:MAG: RHS repeat-associated core domain-containing protein, partial [Candidatus Binatia bacterium]